MDVGAYESHFLELPRLTLDDDEAYFMVSVLNNKFFYENELVK